MTGEGQESMRGEVASHKLKLEFQKLVELPVASPLLSGLLDTITNEDVTIRQFAALVRQDPSLTARIIGLANSAYFGQANPVTSVEDAIFKALGLRMAKSLALSIVMAGSFSSYNEETGFALKKYWISALLSAFLARQLSEHVGGEEKILPDTAYLAGLLHDFGFLPLLFLYHNELEHVFEKCHNEKELTTVFQSSIGTDHHEVGEWVAQKWHLPQSIIAVMGHYHEDDYAGDNLTLVKFMHGVIGIVHAHLCDAVRCEETPAYIYMIEQMGIAEPYLQGALANLQRKEKELESIASKIVEG